MTETKELAKKKQRRENKNLTSTSRSRIEIDARASEKRTKILDFLSSGEVWTTVQVVNLLLCCSRQSSLRTLKSMGKAGAIKSELCGNTQIFGVTGHGLALALAAHTDTKEFELGKTNPSFINHHIQTQIARLKAESAGWTGWVPGKILYSQTPRLKKIPDALAVRADGRTVAVEIELHVKSFRRNSEILGLYIEQLIQKRHDFVYYFTPSPEALQRALERVKTTRVKGSVIAVSESHRARFIIVSIDEFPATQDSTTNATD